MHPFWIPSTGADDTGGAAVADAGRFSECTGCGVECQRDGGEIEASRLRIIIQSFAKSFTSDIPQTGDGDQRIGTLLCLPAGVAVAGTVIRHGLILYVLSMTSWWLDKIAVADQIITKQCGMPRLDELSREQRDGGNVMS